MSEDGPPSNAEPDHRVRVGDTVKGKYRIDQVLSNSMGLVCRATHLALADDVVLKLLPPSAAADPDSVARFRREARLLAKVKSPHVLRILDVDELPGKIPFIVTEFLEGDDLRSVLKQGPMPLRDIYRIAMQVCEGLACAHGVGIVHRDLKPSNLFVTRTPDGASIVKILDFGIAKAWSNSAEKDAGALTASTTIVGSPRYMSPEQATASRDVDARSDLWSLAVIVHEMCTGRPLFSGDSVSRILLQIMTNQIPSLRDSVAEVPAALSDAVDWALRREASDRMPNVLRFAEVIAPLTGLDETARLDRIARRLAQSSEPTSSSISNGSREAVLDIMTLSSKNLVTMVDEPPPLERRRTRRTMVWAGAGAFAALTAVLSVVMSRSPPPGPALVPSRPVEQVIAEPRPPQISPNPTSSAAVVGSSSTMASEGGPTVSGAATRASASVAANKASSASAKKKAPVPAASVHATLPAPTNEVPEAPRPKKDSDLFLDP